MSVFVGLHQTNHQQKHQADHPKTLSLSSAINHYYENYLRLLQFATHLSHSSTYLSDQNIALTDYLVLNLSK